jgi:GNAT superfamily N-acetyltransferase
MRFFRAAARVMAAHPTEAAVLAELYQRAWTGCDRLLSPLLVEEQTPPRAEVSAWFNGGFEVFRTRQDGLLIGAVRCCFPSSVCNVDRLVVDPDARGRGVGYMLLEHTVGRARRAGVTRIWAQVCPKVEPSEALFRSFGFRETERAHASWWGEEVVLLELPL